MRPLFVSPALRRPPTRVFVLSTGRCGSMTLMKACEHLTNFTTGHESRARRYGEGRFLYPDHHIESDNRLSWMLGDLATRFDPETTHYVHLTRDREEVAQSYLKRWDNGPAAITHGFSRSIIKHANEWPEASRIELCRFYCDVVTANITEFLRHQPRTGQIRLEHVREDFPTFLSDIGAEGDLAAATGEWDVSHNASAG